MVSLPLRSRLILFAAASLAGVVPATARGDDQVKALIEKLNNPVTLERGIDHDTPLKDAMEFLSERYDLTILIDHQAFKEEGVDEIENFKVRSPKMVGIRLGTVLRLVLEQAGASYLVRKDHIEITPAARLERNIWAHHSGPKLPLVHAVFDKRPLDEALKELSAATGITVIVDVRPEGKSKSPVTANLVNATLDDAVRVLADMADLKAVRLESLFYVTSKENAKALQAEQEKRMLGGLELHKSAQRKEQKAEPPKVPAKEQK
jgi:hypothetical protein